jgi:hypothetical protein
MVGFLEDGEVAGARRVLMEAFQGQRCQSKLRTARAARRSQPAPRKKEWRWGQWLGAKGPRTLLLSLRENTRIRDEKQLVKILLCPSNLITN